MFRLCQEICQDPGNITLECGVMLFSMYPKGVSVLPLIDTENGMLVQSDLLWFPPRFGFYSRQLSVACLKASSVSKG